VAADFYKAGAKAAGQKVVTGGPFNYSLRPNYFGDWLRYASFAMVRNRGRVGLAGWLAAPQPHLGSSYAKLILPILHNTE
jgi:steroid 5-alpha reductase family enzyme